MLYAFSAMFSAPDTEAAALPLAAPHASAARLSKGMWSPSHTLT